MPELRVGFDYHLAEVGHNPMPAGIPPIFYAKCNACGWIGIDRDSKWAAYEDAYEHDSTENPADQTTSLYLPGRE